MINICQTNNFVQTRMQLKLFIHFNITTLFPCFQDWYFDWKIDNSIGTGLIVYQIIHSFISSFIQYSSLVANPKIFWSRHLPGITNPWTSNPYAILYLGHGHDKILSNILPGIANNYLYANPQIFWSRHLPGITNPWTSNPYAIFYLGHGHDKILSDILPGIAQHSFSIHIIDSTI